MGVCFVFISLSCLSNLCHTIVASRANSSLISLNDVKSMCCERILQLFKKYEMNNCFGLECRTFACWYFVLAVIPSLITAVYTIISLLIEKQTFMTKESLVESRILLCS